MESYTPRTGPGIASVLLAALCVAVSALRAQETSRRPVDPVLLARALKVYRSPSGRFAVVGARTGGNLTVGKWADDVLARFERETGLSCPSGARAPITMTVAAAADSAAPGMVVKSRGARLAVTDLSKLDWQRATHVLCGCLLDRCVLAKYKNNGRLPALAPEWLTTGILRSLYPDWRARDASAALSDWRKASLPTVAACLSADPGDAEMPPRWGFLVASLLRRPSGPRMMMSAVETLASGGELDLPWLLRSAFDGGSVADAEDWWDGTVLKQRRVVRRPGRMTDADRDSFEAALLLYPGSFGMPLSRALYEPVPWSSLIALKDAQWMDEFCRQKAVSLRILAAGRGKALQTAAEAYAVFLQELARGKRDGRLEKRLAEAEAAMEALQPVGAEQTGE